MEVAGSLRAVLQDARARWRVPALGAAVVGPEGDLDLEVVGTTAAAGGRAVAVGDGWELGRATGALTALLWARLVDAGDAGWNERVPDLLPRLAGQVHPGWDRTAVASVLVHRAGLPPAGDLPAAATSEQRPLGLRRQDVLAAALADPPVRDGTARWSALGSLLVAAAVEERTGGSYEDALTRLVLAPLGVGSATWAADSGLPGHPPDGPAARLRLRLERTVAGERPAEDRPPGTAVPAVLRPADGLRLSLPDWARVHRAVHEPSRRGDPLLSAASRQRLLTPATGPGPHLGMGWAEVRNLPGVDAGQLGAGGGAVAVALLDLTRRWTALVVANADGSRLRRRAAHLAADLLADLVDPRAG